MRGRTEGEVIAEAQLSVDVIVCGASEPSEHFQQGLTTNARKNKSIKFLRRASCIVHPTEGSVAIEPAWRVCFASMAGRSKEGEI